MLKEDSKQEHGKHNHVCNYYFGSGLLSAILGLPCSCLESSFNICSCSLFKHLATNFSKFVPCNNSMEFCLVFSISTFSFPLSICCNTKGSNSSSLRSVTQFRIAC